MLKRAIRCSAMLVVGMTVACTQKTPTTETTPTTAALLPVESSNRSEAVSASNVLDWASMLHCGDTAFMRKPAEQQLLELQKTPAWGCELKEMQGGANLICQPNEPQRAFQGRITELVLNHPNDAHQLSLQLRDTDLATVRKEAVRVWSRGFKPESNQMLLTSDGSISLVITQSKNNNEVSLSCSVAPDTQANISLPSDWQNNSTPSAGSTRFSIDESMTAKLKGDKLLNAIVNCEAEHWLSLDISARQQMLEVEGVLCNGVSDERGQAVECGIPETFKSFGLPAQTLRLMDDGEQHQTLIDVLGDVNTLKRAVEQRTKMPLKVYAGSAGRYINRLDERFQFMLYAGDKKRSQLLCRMWSDTALDVDVNTTQNSASKAEPFAPTSAAKYAKSGISGSIKYPGDNPPAMRICAIDRQTKHYRCIQTAQGQSTYRIDVLHEGGSYVVVAEFDQDELKAAGHANSIRCVMAACPQSELIEVELGLGEYKNGIDLNEFLAQRGNWSALPKNE